MHSHVLPTALLIAIFALATPAATVAPWQSARAQAAAPAPTLASNCAGTSTGLIPINDLGAGF